MACKPNFLNKTILCEILSASIFEKASSNMISLTEFIFEVALTWYAWAKDARTEI